ncbi:P-loop containing nucleoside triphosphate hydrolase protein [Rhypophila decipiens]|uniref:P-loop containing nucleoside triphosphate hydrolase protein n=1 Tax=Rhypophila decipiens TaxID=261697 RepID=A0AAN6XZ77_9PEZI|nr:P-loop containing nucleoside triphosphate hydrolase protein [Rhypophila decipiens]
MSDEHAPWEDQHVDLDHDLQLSEPLVGLVCFGMICDSKGLLLDDPTAVETSGLLSLAANRDAYELRLVSRVNGTFLQFDSGAEVDIAVLDQTTAHALTAVGKVSGCEIDLLLPGTELRGLRSKFKTGTKKIEFVVSAVFYGPSEAVDEVGRLLCKARLYLQDPTYLRPGVSEYNNPHRLNLGDYSMIAPKADAPLAVNDCVQEVETILKNLGHHAELESDAATSGIVTTKLNTHQVSGVNFVAQREGRIPSRLSSLWHEKRINNIQCYEHIITGAKRSRPEDEAFGGILADEMGLGKTLTMLAAVAESVPASDAFRRENSLTARPQSGATLVIAPSALVLEEWLSDIQDHLISRHLRILTHHGGSKAKTAEDLLEYDIVLSTYATLATDLRGGVAVLYQVTWFRGVFAYTDAAHYIRHDQTRQFQAAVNLSAKFRWCLTGTPIHNSLTDLGSLISFLRVPLLNRKAEFNKHIVKPIEEKGRSNSADNLRLLLHSMCLRRTKELINIPEPKEITYDVRLCDEERSLYDMVKEQAKARVEDDISSSNSSGTGKIVLQTVMHLRRICNHGTMDRDIQNSVIGDDTSENDNVAGAVFCSDCECEILDAGRRTPDGKKTLCADCYCEWETKAPKSRRKKGGLPAEADNHLDLTGHSTKVSLLVQDVDQHRNSDKCIIFSSWTRTLDIVTHALSQREIPFRRIDGNTSTAERTKTLAAFQTDKNLVALVMTLGTGAVGLNITAATRVHILEPQWNPYVENQAIGRAVRYGQKRDVCVVRYIVPDTIETYIQDRQRHKLSLSGIGFADTAADHLKALGSLLVG